QYFVTASFYLTGIVPGLLLLVPPMEIYFDLRPMNLSIGVGEWVLFYLGFYLTQVVLAFYALGSFRYETLLLAAVSFPIYAAALWNVLCGKEQAWHVTGADRPLDDGVRLGDVQAALDLGHPAQRDVRQPGEVVEAGVVEGVDADGVH
ncbi:hypothetical protein IAE22_31345, partial [Bacillus sp. S34]|nr:hypothetical protein [Bacillus sp. S34]